MHLTPTPGRSSAAGASSRPLWPRFWLPSRSREAEPRPSLHPPYQRSDRRLGRRWHRHQRPRPRPRHSRHPRGHARLNPSRHEMTRWVEVGNPRASGLGLERVDEFGPDAWATPATSPAFTSTPGPSPSLA
jgi:hypothetical protein